MLRDSVYYDSTRKDLYVDLEIDEGLQYRLGDMSFGGNTIIEGDKLSEKLRIGEGDIYGLSGAELAEMARFAYYEEGYLDTRVVPSEIVRGDTVDVSLQIFEGQPWTCLLYTSPSPRDVEESRMPSSA